MSNIVKFTSQLPAKSDHFLKTHTPFACMKAYSGVFTPLQAVKIDSASLVSLKKNYSEDWTQAYLEMWLVNLNEFLNVARPMNDNQVQETAYMILSRYSYLKISDITLIFSKIKAGDYGPLYEGIDGTKIISIFEKYGIERGRACEDDFFRESELDKDKTEYPRTCDTAKAKTAMKRAAGFKEFMKDKRVDINSIK